MVAAKAFVTALTSGDINQLDRVVYPGQSMPPNELMSIAKLRRIIGMHTTQFTYQPVPLDKNSINVSFIDKTGEKDTWKLSFIQNEAGRYQYDGYLSGTLLSNSTPVALAKSYAEILTHSANKYWVKSINYNQSPGIYDNSDEMGISETYNLGKESIGDFYFNNLWYVNTGNEDCSINLNFKDNTSKPHAEQLNMTKGSDGYYLNSTSGLDTGIYIPHLKINTKTLINATNSFLSSQYNGALRSDQLNRNNRDTVAADILKIADLRKLNRTKKRVFTSFFFNKNEKNAVDINLTDPSRGSDKWKLVFDKTKKGNYQFDAEKSGTLMPNTTLIQLGESYLWVILYGKDPYWLNSLTLKGNLTAKNYDFIKKEATRFKLFNKKINDFNISTNNNVISIAFKGTKGTKHRIDLSTKEVKDGYYIVSQSFQ